jgi:hypothetical protein
LYLPLVLAADIVVFLVLMVRAIEKDVKPQRCQYGAVTSRLEALRKILSDT